MSCRLGVVALGDSITNGGGELQFGVALQSWALWTARGLGISFGLALFPIHGKTPEELIRRADQALYAAKRSDGDLQFAPRAA